MQRITLAVLATSTLVSCVAGPSTPTLQPSADPNAIYAGEERWDVGCQDDQTDPYGVKIEPAKCWAMVSFSGTRDEGLAVSAGTIFEVDAAGPRLKKSEAFSTDVCDEYPVRRAVDGRRIDRLPMSKQIEAVTHGTVFVLEADRPWPYCNVYNEVTTTLGAKRAYERMMALWHSRE